MTLRQKKIWELLVEQRRLTLGQIARLLYISDRTVRNDIKEINQERGRKMIQAVKGQGYSIEGSLVKKNAGYDWEAEEEDLEWQTVRRLLSEGETPYLELADELYISDTQLSKLINRINRRMTQRYDYGEYPILRMNGKLVLKMTEQETRKCYLFYVASRTLKHYFDCKGYQPCFEYVDLEEMKELVLEEL